jgi:hypothetical protein
VNFVDKLIVLVHAKFVFRIYKNEPLARCYFLTTREKRERNFPYSLKKLCRNEALGYPSRVVAWPRKDDFLKHLANQDPSFLTVQSVATAYKHLYPRGTFYG